MVLRQGVESVGIVSATMRFMVYCVVMAPSQSWPVPITTLGTSKGGTVVFKQNGKLHVTTVLKCAFQLVSGSPMKLVDTDDMVVAESYHRNNPVMSVRAASEMAPYLPCVDVLMTGHAYTPAGKPVNRQPVRLAIFHSTPLLDKTLHVYGDQNGDGFLPFERIPLMYEYALGDSADPENPYGTGKVPGSRAPNIVHPRNLGIPAGFGPLSRAVPRRKALLRGMSKAALAQLEIEIPSDFDWTYFQAAPLDQQIPALIGNEWLVLEGVNPHAARITSRLPTVRPIATIFGIHPHDPERAESKQLRIDTVLIDTDTLRCTVICRGVVQIEDERALSQLRIAGAVETEEVRFAHLLAPPPATPLTAKPLPSKTIVRESTGTATMPPINMTIAPLSGAGQKGGVMPFIMDASIPPQTNASASIPGAPWSPETTKKAPPVIRNEIGATLELQPLDLSLPAPIPPPPPEPEALAAERMAAVPDIVPPPAPKEADAMVLPPARVFEAPSAMPEPTAPAPPPAATTRKDIWAPSAPEPPVDVAKPAPPRIPAKASVRNAIYGFGAGKKKG